MPIEPPYEILQIQPDQEVVFHVVRWEVGDIVIHPTWPGAPREKKVRGLRIYVRPEDKAYLPFYWDITPAHLVAGLEPILPQVVGTDQRIAIRAFLTRPGITASKRFQIRILPP